MRFMALGSRYLIVGASVENRYTHVLMHIALAILVGTTAAVILLIFGCSHRLGTQERLRDTVAHYRSEATAGMESSQLLIHRSILASLENTTLRSLEKPRLCFVEIRDQPAKKGALVSGGILIFWIEGRPSPNAVRVFSIANASLRLDVPIPDYEMRANKILQSRTVVFSCVVSLKPSQKTLHSICSAVKLSSLRIGLVADGRLCSNTMEPSLADCRER